MNEEHEILKRLEYKLDFIIKFLESKQYSSSTPIPKYSKTRMVTND